MLVIERREGDRTFITVPPSDVPQEIEVMLCEIVTAKKAKLGFTAAKRVKIMRDDVGPAREVVRTIYDKAPLPVGGE